MVKKTISLKAPKPGTKIIDLSLQTVLSADAVGEKEYPLKGEETTRTIVIPVLAPFAAASQVSYRHATKGVEEMRVEGWAMVSTVLTSPGPSAIHVESIEMRSKVSTAWLCGPESDVSGAGWISVALAFPG